MGHHNHPTTPDTIRYEFLDAVERSWASFETSGEADWPVHESEPRQRRSHTPRSQRERMEPICRAFEAERKVGSSPRIEDYLDRAASEDRERLLRELLVLEIQLREEAGEPVEAAEYLGRFEDDAMVESAFAFLRNHMLGEQAEHSTVDHQHSAESRRDHDNGAAKGLQASALPESIGRYRVVRVLGQGGFATVYLARDTDLDRDVALKVPRLEKFDSEEMLNFFVDEARKSAQLEHPGIVRIHDVQREQDLVYIVQQYVNGGDLAERAKTKRLSHRRIAELMIEVAEAVGYAHQRRYTHLDLKPANILLDQTGNPHVADFGLALHESMQPDMQGQVMGTYAYMSPEQTRGETHRLDGRSDIWSVGVILYELLTGSRPFAGKTAQQLVGEIRHREPRPPRQVAPAVPKELSRITLACLSKLATDRYASTTDLVDDLRHWLEGEGAAKAAASPAAKKIIPQGLRSFEAEHADFYFDLLPGPHDREGLPRRVRFWKQKLEQRDSDETFAVGLMYGPSGCGKSSMVKAGIVPRLADDILPIYVEAAPADTEARLVKALRKRCPELSGDDDLTQLFDTLRRQGGSRGCKVVVVIDQFEQWLHAHASADDSQLIPALRHCDGSGVQCVVLVRDDFWMSATRFMQALEIPLVEGTNSAAVDLFDSDHALKVLAAFGRAYGQTSRTARRTYGRTDSFPEARCVRPRQRGGESGVRASGRVCGDDERTPVDGNQPDRRRWH